ncbi:protein of unknown function DUF115 [Clostridium sp. DL-VIII]|uniref:motility associated factor glycosyltransferase family protein n=1 Tax=Clostridium sp. DL-VIII TaxID=641107 RepID=UPI00023B0639|nr:6-hydroxymethylpterin diphosphokinase MptE-like protein [Clostridium sp. DL-VIII]EHJ01504.1 protein of unknown function DUF115 [Clostridium sp. DL-VIII]
MNFYEENLELFKKEIPILYETIKNDEPLINIELEKVKDSANYLILKDDKKCFVHSIFDVNEEMKNMFKYVDKSVETIIIFGLGCGYSLEYIEDNYKNVDNILVIEPSLQMFEKYMNEFSIHNQIKNFKNITFLINKDENYVVNLLMYYISKKIYRRTSIVCNLSYRTILPDYYEKINKSLIEYLRNTSINIATKNYFKDKWVENPIKNLKNSAINIDKLISKFEGKSAIIVSAGPSLNKNIHLINNAKNKALIAAVGSASKILESNNIKPHFRFAMDSQKEEKLIFENLQEDNSILVYSDKVYPEVIPKFKRRLRMILDSDVLTRYIFNKSDTKFETFRSGFSIANTALDVLIKLGFKNIIFLGQDMSYTKDKLYAEGSWIDNDKLNVGDGKKRYSSTKDIYGNDVYTDDEFLGIKTLFEKSVLNNPNINYINATEGGIGITGTKIKTFEEVLYEDLSEEYDYDIFFDNLFFTKDSYDNDSEKIFNTIIELEKDINEMIKINDLRIKGLKKIDRYLNKELGISKIEREIIYLNKYEEELRQFDLYNNCIKLMMADMYDIILNKFENDVKDQKQCILNTKGSLESISYELRKHLYYIKECIRENY